MLNINQLCYRILRQLKNFGKKEMLLQKNSNKVLVICGKQARRAKDDQISDSDFWPFIENPPHNLLSFDISTISNIDLRKSKSPLRTNKGIIRPLINIF